MTMGLRLHWSWAKQTLRDINPQDGNVGNMGDILKHATLVQLVKVFANQIPDTKYYLDSHSYLYQSRLVNPAWQEQIQMLLKQSVLYQDYIDIEMPYIGKGEYLCSSGLVHHLIPDAHLLLCESNKSTREWLLQQLADNKVTYHTVKEQLASWALRKSFKKLPNLLMLIDPFELTDALWLAANKCLSTMLHKDASAIMLVFDYAEQPKRQWPDAPKGWLTRVANISMQPYHLAVYTSEDFVQPVQVHLAKMGWWAGSS